MKLPLIFLLITRGINASAEKQNRHGRHKREYILCSSLEGEMNYYKNRGDEVFTDCPVDIARAKFINNINETGWGIVDVEVANDKIPAYIQGYAAGFVEGRATRDLIGMHIANTVDGYCDGVREYCDRLGLFLLHNIQYMEEQISHHPNSQYWQHVNMTLNQLAGMIDGFEDRLNARTKLIQGLNIHPIFLIQLAGDVEDLEIKLGKPRNLLRTWIGSGHCSALVKVNDANTDLFFSHVTWTSYSSMLRLKKRYRFKLKRSPGSTYTFSGYPGSIPSVDDFLLSSARLAILETTISNYNKEIMKNTTPETLLCWVRSQVATRLASTTKGWAEIFALHNSGTYNNQWVIVDYKKFKPGMHKLPKGLIHIIEQLPGYIQHGDVSDFLNRNRFWPSYNMPFFPDVYNDSKTADLAEKYGDWFTYEKTPRALIFKRDAPAVQDIHDMRMLMRSNNYTKDPLSRCACDPPFSAENAIACRSDLNPADGKYPFEALGFRDHGATDVKITSVDLMKSLSFLAVAGPTHDPTPLFSWKTAPFKETVSHIGQPDEFLFGPVTHLWNERSMYSY